MSTLTFDANVFRRLLRRGGEDECWLWMGPRSEGYGILPAKKADGTNTTIRAHIVSFILANGYKPVEGMKVCHSCDNPPCCNPRHLWEGTHQQNIQDMVDKGRRLGKNSGEIHGLAKLTDQKVLQMRALKYTTNISFRAIGRQFGVRGDTARRAILGITWSHLPRARKVLRRPRKKGQ